ncbi:cell cycle checkpoint rad17 [Trichoderma cornu-damae]|uniref:Cell cycle checkpoint rad17 n=1 Tax=Trichoderma cornu-damae TaxID=654480 RepID=A0A9P8QTU2_9HYPO|nr:cell cycle checkpoint rad17 [Trichoderma cornu-damae]
MSGLFSYIPGANLLLGGRPKAAAIDLPSVEIHHIETNADRRARCLKHLLKANHVNYAILWNDLRFDNHNVHILSSAYLLGANENQLHDIYNDEIKDLVPWEPSPSELIDEDWRDSLGDKRYQRAFVDFFEDKLAMRFTYDWKQELQHFLFSGEEPLFHGLIGGLGHPLIHLGYAYEMDSKEVAMEALALTSVQYNFFHKYLDNSSYTKPSPLGSKAPLDLLIRMAKDDRFSKAPEDLPLSDLEGFLDEHESLFLEYWNGWDVDDDPKKQFELSQQAAVALLVATVQPGTHAYDFFIVHLLTTSHAVRIILPFLPPQHHVALVREWWLLVLAVFVIKGRPLPDPDSVESDLKGKNWNTDASAALMAPPAKRRRRNTVEASDDEDEQPKANTLTNFLLSSPSSPAKIRAPTASPSPVKRRAAAGQSSNNNGSPLRASRSLKNGTSPSPSPRKTGDTSKDGDRGKTADLKTLFSKQAQKVTRSGLGADRNAEPIDDPISDLSDDDEISEFKASSSSLVGQHARKRLKGAAASTQPTATSSLTMSQRFLRPSRPAAGDALKDDLRPWSERFGPRNLDELAVHKKKVSDVRRWLEDVMRGRMRQRLLILKGAAGTGKTTTVRLLANDMGSEILEWKNPAGGAVTGFVSASAQFEDFLGRGGKFGALDLEDPEPSSTPAGPKSAAQSNNGNAKKIILIEEFPNTFSRSSTALSSFRRTILQYLASQTPSLHAFGQETRTEAVTPVVVVISETLLTTTSASADSLTAHRLLGPEILRHPGVGLIEFNAIAPSLLLKALELVVQKESRKSGRRRTPGPLVLKRLGEIGDVRSAISSLEFLCLKGDQDADWGSKVTFTRQKKGAKDAIALTRGEEESLEQISQREASLGIFHAVGKVVYNKRDDVPSNDAAEKLPSYLSQHSRPKASLVSVDSLVDETGTDTHTFISALHENYVLSCEGTDPMDLSTPMDYVNECVEYLSLADLLSPSRDVFFGGRGGFGGSFGDSASHVLRQDEMTFQVAVRGMLFSLPNPVKRKTWTVQKGSDAFKMFYPTSLKLWRTKEEIEGLIDVWSGKILKGEAELPARSITDGASIFRRSQPSASSKQSQKPVARAATSTGSHREEEAQDSPATPTLGSTARRELLLDRLPYMAHIARGRKVGTRQRDLEKIVSFSGVTVAPDDESDADEDAAAGETWATDKPSEEANPRKKRMGIKSGAVTGLLKQKLVLSDDDIED